MNLTEYECEECGHTTINSKNKSGRIFEYCTHCRNCRNKYDIKKGSDKEETKNE